jgi:hypothetical protein
LQDISLLVTKFGLSFSGPPAKACEEEGQENSGDDAGTPATNRASFKKL